MVNESKKIKEVGGDWIRKYEELTKTKVMIQFTPKLEMKDKINFMY